MSLRVIFLGPPGAGKGTQAALLCSRAKLPHISTGEIFRAAVKDAKPLGQQVQGFLDRGELVPDSLTIALIKERLARPDCEQGFVLDGYPRTVEQAKALDRVLGELNCGLTHVLQFTLPEEELLNRIKKRGASGSGRSDDADDVAKRRLEVYHKQTAPVSEFYREKGAVRMVDALGSVDEVYRRVSDALGL